MELGDRRAKERASMEARTRPEQGQLLDQRDAEPETPSGGVSLLS